MSYRSSIIYGWKAKIVNLRIFLFELALSRIIFDNFIHALLTIKRLQNFHHKIHKASSFSKYIKSGSQYFWSTDYCGYPSEGLKSLFQSEFLRFGHLKKNKIDSQPNLQTVIWGITNRCPLSCKHCYEWENIACKDSLDLENLKILLDIFRVNGIRHIQFSGGEPLVRFDDLAELVRVSSSTADCWLLTSGFGFTQQKAMVLKESGLKGVQISLDHWDDHLHNEFRNNDLSYQNVIEAVHNCLEAGIMVSLSLCATTEFVSEDNLMKYADLAKDLGVQFIRILEPRSVGKYAGQNVDLKRYQVELLSDFSTLINENPRYKDYPIVSFYGYHQRKMGCFGAGDRYIYVDPNGAVHACPFCRGSVGNLLEESFPVLIEKLRTKGCHQFRVGITSPK